VSDTTEAGSSIVVGAIKKILFEKWSKRKMETYTFNYKPETSNYKLILSLTNS
jgi:hypothetical protein